MAIWYEVEKTEHGIKQFMECNWDFHDFTIARVSWFPEHKSIELLLKYDCLECCILVRFVNVNDFRIVPPKDDYSAALGGALLILEEDKMTWLADDSYSPELSDEIKKYATWIQADRIIWAVTDGDGNPAEMPASKLQQTWNVNGILIEKQFDLKEYQENSDEIL